jgi:ADP-ribose pyrophosphatase YjhB (NUDIX family)
MDGSQDNVPRWTIPRRTRVSTEDLHISDFNLVRKSGDKDSIMFVKAGPKFPVSFKRGKWLLPAAILDFGEKPKDVAKRILNEQLGNVEYLEPTFLSMQSYFGAHWDIVFIFEEHLGDGRPIPTAKEPFEGVSFHNLNSLPRHEIAEDHLEVLDEMKKGI